MKKADQLFKELLNENLGYIDLKPINQIEATPKTDFENKFAEFLAEESKREKEDEAVKVDSKKVAKSVEEIEDHNFDYKDQKNLDNQIGQEVMNGVYFEAKQNPDKTIDEIKEIVSKNLAKDRQYYMKNAAFGVEGIGYEDTELEEVSGKYAASGYSDKLKKVVKESLMGEMQEGYGAEEYEKGKEAGEKIEKKKMKKKAKKESIDTDLAEIDKQAQVVALEAKLAKMDEVIEGKMSRINMVSEDENLSELVDKKKMKAMQKEVKVLEKRKAKMEKMYEKMCGKKYQKAEMMDEVESINEELDGGVYEIPKDVSDEALKPYIGKFLKPTDAKNDMVSNATEYDKEGGLFKVGQKVELNPAVSLSSFGKSLGKPEKAKDDNEKPAEYRDESGKKVKNPDFNIRKVSYKLVK